MSEWEVQNTEPISTQWAVDKDQPQSTGGADVGKGFAKNFLPTVGNAAKEMVKGVVNLPGTMRDMASIQKEGLQERIGASPKHGDQYIDEEVAGMMKNFLANRYGGMENLKQTIKNDPGGFF